ncbi:MAG: neutral/alkaline non-lysosomal ceramidase N-terminal domain-containing protein, partial [Actinobacteria bacterium]|nr:neutral/alkaline non-lysosomal ceramidase N-terminal domain-containing protein [Actinomycetota bacterium]
MPVLRAGAATTVITPAAGLELEGYLREGPSVGVLDDLTCQAVVFDDGATRLAVAAADLIGMTRPLRERVCAGLDLPPEQVMLTATHTHCGPANLASPGHEDLLDLLAERIIQAITAAMSALQPVRLIAGTAVAEGVAANRRDPAGPVDHEATFLALVSADGGMVATIVNFACHPTILDAQTRSYSADFPGAARQAIEGLCGGQCVYLQGAAGDINPVRTEPSAAETRRTGAILGAAVAREVLLSLRSLDRAQVINPSTESARTVTVLARGRLIQPAPLRARLTEVAVEPRNHPPLAAIRAAHAAATN